MEQSIHATGRSGFEPASTGAIGPFVVNLCVSVAPLELKAASLPGLEKYRVYQVRRVEDDRPRYRLRLGFFADETAVEVALAAVRKFYPGAFSVAAASDDLKHAPGFDPGMLGSRPAPAPKPVAAVQAAAPASVKKAPAAPVAAPRPSVPAAPTRQPQILELLPNPPPRAPEMRVSAPANKPFRVKPADPAALTSAPAELKLQMELPADIRKLTAGLPPAALEGPVLIDSTQTLRMLTESELSDTNAPPWFAVQLAVSDQPINLDTMPKLDIFSAFRLYSVAMPQQGSVQHSLRLGFFRESVSAEAVAGYLKTFFSAPDVLRVSAAEQTRFAERPKPPVLDERAVRSADVVQLRDSRTAATPAMAPVLKSGVAAPRKAAAAAVASAPPAPPNKALANPKAKPAAAASALARKSSQPLAKRKPAPNRSLNDLLREEARQVALSESGIRQIEVKGSLLSRLVGKLTR